MVCTFGDTTDVIWWRELDLPTRTLVGRDGRLRAGGVGRAGLGVRRTRRPRPPPTASWPGRRSSRRRPRIVELLAGAGALVGEPRPITHPVKFYEKGERPLEIVSSRQWFVRTLPLRDTLLARGDELDWHPPFMAHRYRAWVEGLNGDWNISRQRFFGVPFPVWYPIADDGAIDHDRPMLPGEDRLPVDPSTDVPDGFSEDQRGQPGGFVGDPDVMDTWATSSLTPQIAGRWVDDPDLFGRVFPMDLRPQAHEIIRTWLFSTVVRSQLELGVLPWANAAISGWVLDPDRKKMSKSKGNVVTPMPSLEQHGADAVRYWAASRPTRHRHRGRRRPDEGRPAAGHQDPERVEVRARAAGRRAGARARRGHRPDRPGPALPARPRSPPETTAAFDDYDYTRALERTETFFWAFCDDYLELVKSRAYGDPADPATASARGALAIALSVQLRLFAPFLPFVTEEVWHWWQTGSVHRASWPTATEIEPALAGRAAELGSSETLDLAAEVLGAVRRQKTTEKRSMRAGVARLTVVDTKGRLTMLREAEQDLRDAGSVAELVLTEGPEPSVTVELAPEEA